MSLWQYLSGSLVVELTSAELPAALSALNARGVEISALQWKGELTCRFSIPRSQYDAAVNLAKKRGEALRIRQQTGLYWQGKKLLRRPVLLSGLAGCLALSLWLPTRVLFVEVEGSSRVPQAQILEAARKYGVFFGADRRELRSEKVKNGLLSELPALQWAGVNTAGCVTTVSVKEGLPPETEETSPEVSHIIAARDGFVLSGTVRQGNALFHTGQTVKQGQVLISGYTDCGFSIRAVRASGEIEAQTNRQLRAVMCADYLQRRAPGGSKYAVSLIFRKKRINLWKDSGISEVSCGRMYEEYYVTLPGGFRLPLSVCIEEYTQWELTSGEETPAAAEESLKSFAREYLKRQMIAGTVRQAEESVGAENAAFVLHGDYICTEMIGREQPEQIGEANGKIN